MLYQAFFSLFLVMTTIQDGLQHIQVEAIFLIAGNVIQDSWQYDSWSWMAANLSLPPPQSTPTPPTLFGILSFSHKAKNDPKPTM